MVCHLNYHISMAFKNSKMINGQLLPDSFKDFLLKVGCQIVSPEFEVEHPQLSLYMRDISASGFGCNTMFTES